MSDCVTCTFAEDSGPSVDYPTDEEIMCAIQEGHLHLLGTLFGRHQDKVYGRCFQLVRSRDEADDLLQEAFLRVLRYRDSFKGTAQFSTWLYRIVTNVCLDHLKSEGRAAVTQQELAAEAPTEERAPEADERLALTKEAMERLAPGKRELILDIRVRGLGYSEAAAEAGISEGAIRVRVHRAIQELKSIMDSLQESDR